MSGPPLECCDKCHYYMRMSPPGGASIGLCCRRSPVPIMYDVITIEGALPGLPGGRMKQPQICGAFPQSAGTNWCGEFEESRRIQVATAMQPRRQ